MYEVFIGLGGNIGDRFGFLQSATHEIGCVTEIEEASAVYETEPVGFDSKHKFLNVVLKIHTDLEPPVLLHKLKYIEKKLGRSASTHLKDREIDIDILLYDGLYYEDHELHVPHPSVADRRFVLIPLSEVAPALKHPVSGKSVKTLLSHCPDKSHVRKEEYQLELFHLHS